MVIKKYEKFEEIEMKLIRKSKEFDKLNNKIHRYWRRLVKESLSVAKERKLTISLLEDSLYTNSDITLIKKGNRIIYDHQLLELSKETLPSLYRRYLDSKKKLDELKKPFKEIYKDLENLTN